MEDLQTDLGETLLSSQRDNNHEDLNNAGGVDDGAENGETEYAQPVSNRDSWIIECDYLVRRHLMPRTTPVQPA